MSFNWHPQIVHVKRYDLCIGGDAGANKNVNVASCVAIAVEMLKLERVEFVLNAIYIKAYLDREIC